MSAKSVTYRGMQMAEGWPERIQQAQRQATYRIGGQDYPRVRYGREADDRGADDEPCPECAVLKGELHVPGCEAEQCPACGGPATACACAYDPNSR